MKRKKIFSFLPVALAAIVFTFIFTSCGSSSGQSTSATMDPTDDELAPTPVPTTQAATFVAIGQIKERRITNGECDGANCDEVSVTIQVSTGSPTATFSFPLAADDRWDTNAKDPGKTEELKEFVKSLKEKKPADFSVTTGMINENEQVIRVTLLPVYKDGEGGKVAEIASEEVILYERKQ